MTEVTAMDTKTRVLSDCCMVETKRNESPSKENQPAYSNAEPISVLGYVIGGLNYSDAASSQNHRHQYVFPKKKRVEVQASPPITRAHQQP